MSSPEAAVVRAAGGVIRRRDGRGRWRYVVVHRPRYDDWSLPKGKADPSESDDRAALREVEEETGLRCILGAELPAISYTDRRGRPKRVRYWLMEPAGPAVDAHEFQPNTEVDELRWCTLDEADRLLSYEHDRRLIGSVETPT